MNPHTSKIGARIKIDHFVGQKSHTHKGKTSKNLSLDKELGYPEVGYIVVKNYISVVFIDKYSKPCLTVEEEEDVKSFLKELGLRSLLLERTIVLGKPSVRVKNTTLSVVISKESFSEDIKKLIMLYIQ